jgi:hypothetical protein
MTDVSTPAQRAAARITAAAAEKGRVTVHLQGEPPVIPGLSFNQRRAAERRAMSQPRRRSPYHITRERERL